MADEQVEVCCKLSMAYTYIIYCIWKTVIKIKIIFNLRTRGLSSCLFILRGRNLYLFVEGQA